MTRTLLGASLALALLLCRPAVAADLRDQPLLVPRFKLTERNGEAVTDADLRGKVWVASFVLTRCKDGQCPQVTRTVQRLQGELAGRRDVRFVTFTVDPERDDPAELKRYADEFGADPTRWLFLTGNEDQIEALQRTFLQPGKVDEKTGVRPHLPFLFVVNRKAEVVSYHRGMLDSRSHTEQEFERNLLQLRRSVDKALQPDLPAWMPRDFPAFNAALNALASVLIVLGYVAIRRKMVRLHVTAMLSALAVSALFLASYLFFHIYIKEWRPTRFVDQAPDAPAWVAAVYAAVLLSHTALAIVATPMALIAAYLGLRNKLSAHTKLARWALPIWLYVAVTGVVVYLMLYRLYPVP